MHFTYSLPPCGGGLGGGSRGKRSFVESIPFHPHPYPLPTRGLCPNRASCPKSPKVAQKAKILVCVVAFILGIHSPAYSSHDRTIMSTNGIDASEAECQIVGKSKKIEIIDLSPNYYESLAAAAANRCNHIPDDNWRSQREAHTGCYWQIAGTPVWHPQIERLRCLKYLRSNAVGHPECWSLPGIPYLDFTNKCIAAIIGRNFRPLYADIGAQFELGVVPCRVNQITSSTGTFLCGLSALPQNFYLFGYFVELNLPVELSGRCFGLGMFQLLFASTPQLIGGLPQGPSESSNSDSSKSGYRAPVIVKKFSDLDGQEKRHAISGAIFLASCLSLLAYLALKA